MPVAICAAICGVAGLALQLTSTVGVNRPPNLLAVNLSFCAILMGAGIILYARGTPGTGRAAVAALLGILTGMVGPMVFAKQTVDHHLLTENRELDNVRSIALAAGKYAANHDGAYPADLLILLDEKLLAPEQLESPFVFGKRHETLGNLWSLKKSMKRPDLLRALEEDSDYLYSAGDVKLPAAPIPENAKDPGPGQIIVASSNTAVMRKNLAVSFVDGTSRFITVDQIDDVMAACNKGRATIGLPALRPPPIIQHAIDEANGRVGVTQESPPATGPEPARGQ
jgi:hypothetical protein